MKAMIFAAGLGSRLGDLTATKPKALVEVGGEPMLKRTILRLKNIGIHDIVVNVHHFADQIIRYIDANNRFGINISISDERDLLLDTGGGLLKANGLLDGTEPILLHNVDILTDIDFREMIEYHIKENADVTLLAAERKTSRYFLFNDNLEMVGWKNTTTGEIKSPSPRTISKSTVALAFGGIHIINPCIFDTLNKYAPYGSKFSITHFYIDNCENLKIKAYKAVGYKWVDMGKPDSFIEAQNIASELQLK